MVFTQKMINFITSTHTNTITVTNTINTITDNNNSYFLLLYTSSSTNLFPCIS